MCSVLFILLFLMHLVSVQHLAHWVDKDVTESLWVSYLSLARELVSFGVQVSCWILSKLSNIWDDMNTCNFLLNLGMKRKNLLLCSWWTLSSRSLINACSWLPSALLLGWNDSRGDTAFIGGTGIKTSWTLCARVGLIYIMGLCFKAYTEATVVSDAVQCLANRTFSFKSFD